MKKKIDKGEFAEGYPWVLHAPYVSTLDPNAELPCKHCQWTGPARVMNRFPGVPSYSDRPYSCPEVAECKNEAGYNGTLLCLRCADEARDLPRIPDEIRPDQR
jgi:hypothetical protein